MKHAKSARTKLAYGIYLITTLFAVLTAIEITHLIMQRNSNNENFQLINTPASGTVDVFLGGKSAREHIWSQIGKVC